MGAAAAGTSVVYGVGEIFLMRGSDRAMRITETVASPHSVLLPVVLFLAAIMGIETTGGQGIRPAVVSGLLCGPLIGLNLGWGSLRRGRRRGNLAEAGAAHL